MKPKILILPGTAYAGTTPFYYTLRNAKFCNAGYHKEFHYLEMMHQNDSRFDEWMLEGYTKTKLDWRTQKPLPVTKEWDENYYKGLFSPPHSFDKYIHHMMHLHESYPEYHAPCDCSNHIVNLPVELLTDHAKAIKPYFDVKVIMLIADPVFRYYQELGGLINQKIYKKDYSEKKRKILYTNKDLLIDHYVRNKKQQKLFRYCVEKSIISNNCNYEFNHNKLCWSYGNKNVLVIEMEKFWQSSYDKETFDKLCEFLEYEISPEHLYPNQYLSKDKNIEGLKDQCTEFEPLTDELYEKGKKVL